MAFRGNESPMDFQYDNNGPLDPSSPFSQYTLNQQKKRTHSQSNSPKKSFFPSFVKPARDSSVFSKPPPTTAVKSPTYRTTSFTTPRKPFDIDIDFSSADPSPAQQTEHDSPDTKPLPAVPIEFKSRPNKRNSLFNFYGKWAPSSGKGEIKKTAPSEALTRKVHKKRRQGDTFGRRLARARRESEGSDEEPPTPQRVRRPHVEEVGWMTGLFTFIHKYPDAPAILTKYLQVFFNSAILFGTLYVIWSFWSTIKADVDKASESAIQDVLAEMAQCAKNYVENRCEPDKRLPALETVCTNWELCMNRDANAVKRASLSAHTFAEIFNSFVEPISLKTMAFTVIVIASALLLNNMMFSHFRRNHESSHHEFRHPSASYMYPNLQAANMGQIGMVPGLSHSTQPNYGWHNGYIEQPLMDHNTSPTKSTRGASASPAKKRLAVEG